MCAALVSAHDPEDLARFFRGLTENVFHGQLGVVDPPLIEYVSALLVRFIRSDGLRGVPFRSAADRERLARLLDEAPADTAVAEYIRIGDATLFWSGVYPEALRRFQPLDYRAVGLHPSWTEQLVDDRE